MIQTSTVQNLRTGNNELRYGDRNQCFGCFATYFGPLDTRAQNMHVIALMIADSKLYVMPPNFIYE